jgi:hypothetical protein
MPAGDLGVRALVTRGRKGAERIRHATRDLEWEVLELVESWEHRDGSRAVEGKPVLKSWEVLLVQGPLPGRPGECGRFMLEVACYGDLPDAWLTPLD